MPGTREVLNGSIVLTPFFLMSTSWKGLLASAYLSFVLFFGMKPFLCSFFQTISSLLCKYIPLPPGERLLQAGRRHSRHPAGRSWRQCGRCQNPGEFPRPHGAEEDKEWRARPEGPGSGGTRRSWGRPGRLGRRPQRRLGQVRRAGRGRRAAGPPFPDLGPREVASAPPPQERGRRRRGACLSLHHPFRPARA